MISSGCILFSFLFKDLPLFRLTFGSLIFISIYKRNRYFILRGFIHVLFCIMFLYSIEHYPLYLFIPYFSLWFCVILELFFLFFYYFIYIEFIFSSFFYLFLLIIFLLYFIFSFLHYLFMVPFYFFSILRSLFSFDSFIHLSLF